MAIAPSFERFYRFLANLGLVLHDDPPKVVDLTGRAWGAAVNGLSLSIREVQREEPGQQVVLSVVIRNAGPEPKTLIVPGWLFFYEAEITASDGTKAPLSYYGNQLLKTERGKERLELTLGSGEAKETDLLVGALYAMRPRERYRVVLLSRLEDGVAMTSNEIEVTG